MTKISWDAPGTRFYETGVDRGVLYPEGATGVAWNGLSAVTQAPTGAEVNSQYADNSKYANIQSPENFEGTIESYTYPEEFEQCDGSASVGLGISIGQQPRKPFNLAYRTLIGNDISIDAGYQIHLIYNAMALPTEKSRTTVSDTPEAMALSWGFTTTPVISESKRYHPSSHVTINSLRTPKVLLSVIEDILYGTEDQAPTIMSIDTLLDLYEANPQMFMLNPNPTTGLVSMTSVDAGDLFGSAKSGLYIAPHTTRLKHEILPGLFQLE